MIYEKLQKARVELQNKKLKKSGKNNYSGFTYYELADFLPQINQIFYDLKLSSNFSMKDGYAILTVTDWEDETFTDFITPTETLELKGCTRIQALGGVHTYLKRYLYLNALEIVESDMLDAKAGQIEEVKKDEFIPDVLKDIPTDEENTQIDLLEGLKATSDKKRAFAYFQENVSKAKDKTAFRKEYQKHIKQFEEKTDE